MQFRDLGRQYQALKPDLDAAVIRLMGSAEYIGGKPVAELEEELASYAGTKHCITCGNGTDALQLALMSWEIGHGDAVIVPDFTFFSSGEVVSALGATPLFVDVDEDTFNIDYRLIGPACDFAEEQGLTPKAVISVDLFGLPANYPKIKDACSERGLLLLEDGAQGFGGLLGNEKACSFGDISTTSFFPAKPLGCYGDGGAVFTDDDSSASLIRSLAVHGKGSMKYDNIRIGMNSRLDAIQAAILQVKFRSFVENEIDAVNKAALIYGENLAQLAKSTGIALPVIPDGCRSAWAQYTIRLPEEIDRSELQASMKSRNVPTMVYYPKPMHLQKAFERKCLCLDGCPVTEHLCKSVLSLPMSPYLARDEILHVVGSLHDSLGM